MALRRDARCCEALADVEWVGGSLRTARQRADGPMSWELWGRHATVRARVVDAVADCGSGAPRSVKTAFNVEGHQSQVCGWSLRCLGRELTPASSDAMRRAHDPQIPCDCCRLEWLDAR
jgi:hypothetical protein